MSITGEQRSHDPCGNLAGPRYEQSRMGCSSCVSAIPVSHRQRIAHSMQASSDTKAPPVRATEADYQIKRRLANGNIDRLRVVRYWATSSTRRFLARPCSDPATAESVAVAEMPTVEPADRKTAESARKIVDPGKEREELAPLFLPEVADDLRSRWAAVQSSFVDDPRQAVRQGDELVAEVMKSLADSFSNERAKLEAQVDQTDKMSTEDLRVALRGYRSFFERLLAL